MDADLVIPVPDSGTPAAIGYSQESGIPFALGITRNQYVGRTFIEPTDHIRSLGVRLKLNVNRAMVKGKKVALIGNAKRTIYNSDGSPNKEPLPIDNHYDVIVRLNMAMVGTRLGARTDILGLAQRNICQHVLTRVRPMWILWTRPEDFRDFPPEMEWLRDTINVAILPKPFLTWLQTKMGTTKKASGPSHMSPGRRVPSTGLLMLLWLLRDCEPAWVDVWGFDFWKSGTTSTPERSYPGPHDYQMERAILFAQRGWTWIDPSHNDPERGLRIEGPPSERHPLRPEGL